MEGIRVVGIYRYDFQVFADVRNNNISVLYEVTRTKHGEHPVYFATEPTIDNKGNIQSFVVYDDNDHNKMMKLAEDSFKCLDMYDQGHKIKSKSSFIPMVDLVGVGKIDGEVVLPMVYKVKDQNKFLHNGDWLKADEFDEIFPVSDLRPDNMEE